MTRPVAEAEPRGDLTVGFDPKNTRKLNEFVPDSSRPRLLEDDRHVLPLDRVKLHGHKPLYGVDRVSARYDNSH